MIPKYLRREWLTEINPEPPHINSEQHGISGIGLLHTESTIDPYLDPLEYFKEQILDNI